MISRRERERETSIPYRRPPVFSVTKPRKTRDSLLRHTAWLLYKMGQRHANRNRRHRRQDMESEGNNSTMVTGESKLHVVFLPFFAPSHMIPLVHIARLFAARGVQSTIITTFHNSLIFKSSIDQDIAAGHPISLQTLDFPASEVGLPVGIENFSAITSPEMSSKIYHGMMLLQNPMQQLIRDLSPDCIFSDMFFPWTVDLAGELRIPRLLFYVAGFMYHSIFHSLKVYAPQDHIQSESESFQVPNLPTRVEMKRSQLQEHLKTKTNYGQMIEKIQLSEKRSYGLVHNKFYEMEPAYADHFKKIKDNKVWHIGPLFQYFNGEETKNGDNTAEKHSCLSWLDDQKPESVIFICFGSMVSFQEAQLVEIALALEESGRPFVWVVRDKTEKDIKRNNRLPERTENNGLIVTGWAPQVKILEHPAVGGFLTHCGWNSVLEAVVAGVPLITWPLYAEHFYNEKVVEELGVGVGVGAEVWNPSFEIKSPIIGKDSILNAINELMGEVSEKGELIRRASKEMAIKAKKAVEESGSSCNDLTALIEDMRALKVGRKL